MLRPLAHQDLAEVIKIESACQVAPWSEDVFKRCLEAGITGWMIEIDKRIVGFILIILQLDEVHILNFCVHPDYQRLGHGEQLLSYMLQYFKHPINKLVYLEVRRSNQHAIKLYEKVGFKKIGERKDYYSLLDQREDALVFAMHLIAE